MNVRKYIAGSLVAVIAFSMTFTAIGFVSGIYSELATSRARAAAIRFSVAASAAQTATGQGGGVAVAGITEMIITLDVTAVSGTTPTLTFYMQASRDGGSTWFDLPHQGALVLISADQQGSSSPAGNRNVVSLATTTFKALARYQVFGDYVRPAWVIGGTTPSFTFQVDAVGK